MKSAGTIFLRIYDGVGKYDDYVFDKIAERRLLEIGKLVIYAL